MNRSDLFMMALQNLWARKSRTAFNIFGIVVSCSMLLLVFAGTRGARDGLMNLFNESDFAKHFAITPGRDRSKEPTIAQKETSDLGEGIDQNRRERISEKLTKAWESKNYPPTVITLERLEQLRGLSKVTSVLPMSSLRTQLSIGDQNVAARLICFSPETSGLAKRVIAGHKPQSHSSRGKIWIDEYRAWRMGYKTDKQLEELVGTKVKLRFPKASSQLPPGMKTLAGLFGVKGIAESQQIADAFRKLFADLDQTSLDDMEKELLRAAASRLGLDSAPDDKAELPIDNPGFIFREFEIAGIVRPPEQSASSLFELVRTNRGKDLLVDWRDFDAIEKASIPKRTHYYNIGTVKNTEDLAGAIALVEDAGFETRSALEILERADEELGKVRLIVAAIALVILLIASVGIMNTMIIAVMERTPEFGIMKAVGSKDSDIRWLMLIEAALTGILGAIVSFGAAMLIDSVISQFARRYIEERIRGDFDFHIFVYSFSDILIVSAIAIIICMLASLIPSRRAAKLDPVAAMK